MQTKAITSLSMPSIRTTGSRGGTGTDFRAPRRLRILSGSLATRTPEASPSLFRLYGDPVELAALKKAEDSNAIILRLYEPQRKPGQLDD